MLKRQIRLAGQAEWMKSTGHGCGATTGDIASWYFGQSYVLAGGCIETMSVKPSGSSSTTSVKTGEDNSTSSARPEMVQDEAQVKQGKVLGITSLCSHMVIGYSLS